MTLDYKQLLELVRQMKAVRQQLDGLPDDYEFSVEDTDAIDDCRVECFHLKCATEAIVESLTGRSEQAD